MREPGFFRAFPTFTFHCPSWGSTTISQHRRSDDVAQGHCSTSDEGPLHIDAALCRMMTPWLYSALECTRVATGHAFLFWRFTSSITICKILSRLLASKVSSNDQCHFHPSVSSITALSTSNLTRPRIQHGYHEQYISEAFPCFVLSVVPTEE